MTVIRFEAVDKEYAVGSLFEGTRSVLHALRDVSFELGERQMLGLVGESGSGKSTIARLTAGLLKPTRGSVTVLGRRIDTLSESQLRSTRRQLGFVFQDPYASLNPRQRIATILELPFRLAGGHSTRDIQHRVLSLLDRVGLTPPDRFSRKFPHQLSGGQRQRVAIARAIALKPRLLIADEPVSSLDVSVGGQILNLLREVQSEIGSSMLFISHDLALVRSMCEDVLVLHSGQIVEAGPAEAVLRRPAHPYSQQLVASMPSYLALLGLDRLAAEPTAVEPDEGCLFRGRCPFAFGRCASSPPLLEAEADRRARCWLLDEPAPPPGWSDLRQRLAELELVAAPPILGDSGQGVGKE
jgi:oligopeptide/dipeptide ABC transporter ATP-binding protein